MKKLEEAAKKYINDLPFDKIFDDCDIKKAIEFGAEWQQSNQWISVEDKPLEIRISALFYIPKYNLTVLGFLESDGVAIWCDGSAYFAKDVTHWMHIPELPKELFPKWK